MKKEQYHWKQIKQVVEDIYAVESQKDSWGVAVVYLPELLKNLKRRLKTIKEFIP